MKTSFDWYRVFPQDEKDNAGHSAIDIPVLYLRGDKDYGNIENYLHGFKKSGISNITGKLISQSGHFAPEENPKGVAKEINYFLL